MYIYIVYTLVLVCIVVMFSNVLLSSSARSVLVHGLGFSASRNLGLLGSRLRGF